MHACLYVHVHTFPGACNLRTATKQGPCEKSITLQAHDATSLKAFDMALLQVQVARDFTFYPYLTVYDRLAVILVDEDEKDKRFCMVYETVKSASKKQLIRHPENIVIRRLAHGWKKFMRAVSKRKIESGVHHGF